MTEEEFNAALEQYTNLKNQGMEYYQSRQLTPAREHWEAAVSLLQETILAVRPHLTDDMFNALMTNLARDLNNIGGVYQSQGDLVRALDYFQRALAIFQAVAPGSTLVATGLNNIGYVYDSQGDLVRALDYYQRALAIDEAVAPQSTQTATDLNNIGYVLQVQGKFAEASGKYEQTVVLVEGLRRTAGGYRGADAIVDKFRGAYLGWIDCLFAQNIGDDHAAAFHVAERLRARTLAERLTERTVRPAAQTPEQETLLENEESLRFTLASALDKATVARRSGDETLMTLAERHVNEVEALQQRNEDALRRVFPQYAQLAYPEPITLADVQATLLDPGTLLLSYLISGNDLYLWAVRQTDYRMLLLPLTTESVTENVASVVSRFHGGAVLPGEETKSLDDLSDVLLAQVPKSLWNGVTRLIIISTGILNYLPFEMLSTDDDPVGVNYEVSYSPSATFLKTVRDLWDKRVAPEWERQFVGIGDPEIPDNPETSEDSETLGDLETPDDRPRSVLRAGLGRLPGTRYEVKTIARAFGDKGQQYLGLDATECNTFQSAPNARYIQLATHGFFDGTEPLNSFLLMSAPQPTDPEGHDQRLCVYEMFGLALNAEMVSCSACVTGLSQERPGQGLVGMNTALLTAGAKCVLTTLWPVNDTTMAHFMIVLYQKLQQGMTVGQALKATRSEIRSIWDDPLHWAPVIATGLT